MKYIDLELMQRTCDLKNKNLEQDDLLWKKCLNHYYSYLDTIQSRFSKSFFSFYTKTGLHDSILKELKITKRHLSKRVCLDLETHWELDGKRFSLTFQDVRNFITRIDLTAGYCEFGDYIIGEFSEVDEKYLSFEFLFYNDSTVYLEFKRLIFKRGKRPDKEEPSPVL